MATSPVAVGLPGSGSHDLESDEVDSRNLKA